MDKKKLKNDLILIGSILLVVVISIVILALNRAKTHLFARISVANQVVETVDLDKKEDRYIEVQGVKGIVKIHTKNGAIAIVESNCPHQDCVHMGYVSEAGRPIICTYNQVVITIIGASTVNDVEL